MCVCMIGCVPTNDVQVDKYIRRNMRCDKVLWFFPFLYSQYMDAPIPREDR
jgi:hypothetical protein